LEKGALSREELCSDPTVVGEVTRLLARHAAQQKLAKFETPQAVCLVSVSSQIFSIIWSSVAVPYVFGPPGSGSGSGSFYNRAKIVNLNSYYFLISL
jgi:hypothetical protein